MDKEQKHKLAGKLFIIIPILVCVIGIGYGLYHDFTPEYEATHKYGPPQYVYDEENDKIIPWQEGMEYPTLIFEDEEGNVWTNLDEPVKHGRKSTNFEIQGNMVVPLTPLDEEGLKIQEEQGCVACHPK